MSEDAEERDAEGEEALASAEDARPRTLDAKTDPKPSSASTEPDSLLGRIAAGLRAGDSPGQTLLATFVAWSTTVAPASLSRSATRPAAFVSVLALVCGLAGPVVRGSRPTLARHLGITAFLALVTCAWLLGSAAIAPARLDPLRAAVGAVAWGAYALSWRERWDTGQSKPLGTSDPDAPLLKARSTLPRGALPIAAIGIVASLAYLVLAWTVRDADRALAAQGIAVACAVFVSTVAASIAVDRGRRSSRPSRRITPYAARALLMLLLFGVVGAAAFFLRT